MISADDLVIVGVIVLIIGLLAVSLWITVDWLIEIIRSIRNGR